MSGKSVKNKLALLIAAAAACLVCLIPIAIPFAAGLAGARMFGIGEWLVGGAILAGVAIYFVVRRKTKSGCHPSA